jgi:hypothetical protein
MTILIEPETWKIVGDYTNKAWIALGPLVGVIVGAYLAGRDRRLTWLADNKKEEYRELISAFTKGLSTYIQQYAVQTIRSGEDERILRGVLANILEVTRSRLFIAKEINLNTLARRWNDLARTFEKDKDSNAFSAGVRGLLDELRDAALEDMLDDSSWGFLRLLGLSKREE